MHNVAIVIFVAGKDVKKKHPIFRGIINTKKLNKKKADEARQGDKNKEKEAKEKQGDTTSNNSSFPVNESRILPERPLTSKMASAI